MSWYTEKFKNTEKTAQGPMTFNCPESGYSVTVQDFSNKGPLVTIQVNGGGQSRVLYDIAVGKWIPKG